MTDLSKKLINAIILTMLVLITSRNKHFANTEECQRITAENVIEAQQIGNQLGVGTRHSFSREESEGGGGLMPPVNCTAGFDVRKLGRERILDKQLVMEIRGTKVMKLIKWWLKELSVKDDNIMGRCFGFIKRLKFVLPIIIFKLGIIVTILVFLSVFSLKSLGIGVLLLILNAGGLIGKVFALKSHHHHQYKSTSSDHHFSAPIYIPIPVHTPISLQYPYPRSHNSPSQIHLHIHNKERPALDDHHHHNLDTDDSSYSYQNTDDTNTSTGGPKSIAQALFGKYAAHASTFPDDYEPYASGLATSPYGYYAREYPPSAWANRISVGLDRSTSEGERKELLALYKRLGFDVRRYLQT